MVDRKLQLLTVLLLGLAHFAVEVAADPFGKVSPARIALGCGLLALALLAARRLKPRSPHLPRWATVVIVCAALLPLLLEPFLRRYANDGHPLEIQFVFGLRNLGLALAAFSAWPLSRNLAGIVALFLTLFVCAMGDQPQIPYFLAALALVGGFWLLLMQRDPTAVQSTTTILQSERLRLRLPLRESCVFGLLLMLALAVAIAGQKRVRLHLGELLPTSGGTGQMDPFARYGVGDGLEEIAGNNALSAGMVESTRLIEDSQDALIDAVSDLFGEARKRKQNEQSERSVAAGKVSLIENHGKLEMNKRPNREFDTARNHPKSSARRPQGSKSARGVFEVEGRTPLHIRVVAYDRYDADSHRWLPSSKPFLPIVAHEAGHDWMCRRMAVSTPAWYGECETHKFKVAALKDNLVPTPSLLTRFRIQRVHRPEYYAWEYDGVLVLDGRKTTPAGVVVQTECSTVDLPRLTPTVFEQKSKLYLDTPPQFAPWLADITRAWTAGVPSGPAQIQAICEHLRSNYILDRQAVAPEGSIPLQWFLCESKRGPEYLFATAAVMMFRSLGYSARFCLGYYASPEAFDEETGHTPVTTADLHFWPELLLADGQWLVVEPTPGYGLLAVKLPWADYLLQQFLAWWAWCGRQAMPLAAAGLAFIHLIIFRRTLLDCCYFTFWKWQLWSSPHQAVIATWRLLGRRAGLARKPRPAAWTLAQWCDQLQADDDLKTLVWFGELAVYGPSCRPSHAPPCGPSASDPAEDIHQLCRRVVAAWPWKRFQTA